MRKNYFILLAFLLLASVRAGAQAWEWAKKVNNAQNLRIVSDGADHIYVSGVFIKSCNIPGASLSAADSAVFIAKYSDSGQLLWHKEIEALQLDLNALQFHNDEIWIGGWFKGILHAGQQFLSSGGTDIFIARINSDGDYTFIKTDGGPDNELLMTMTVYDSYLLCGGSYTGTTHLGDHILTSLGHDAKRNAFFAKYSLDGTVRWAKAIRAMDNNSWGGLKYVKSDPSGSIYVLGNLEGRMNLGGADTSFGYCEPLIKYDAEGNLDRVFFCSGGYAQWVSGMEFDEEGNIYIVKSVGGNHSWDGTRLTKYTSSGQVIWNKTVGGGNDYGPEGGCMPKAMALKNGRIYITGNYQGRITLPGNDILSDRGTFVFKYDLDGNLLMVRNTNGGDLSATGFIDADNSGNIYVAGAVANNSTCFGDVMFSGEEPFFLVMAKLSNSMQESRPSIVLENEHYSGCTGGNVNISARIRNVTMIKWYLPGGYTPYSAEEYVFMANPWRKYDSAGVYSAYVVISNSMYRDSFAYHDLVTINSPEAPVINVMNGMLQCITQSDSVRAYSWYKNDLLISSGMELNAIWPSGKGDYQVRVEYINQCFAWSELYNYEPGRANNNIMANSNDLLVTPNPGNGDFDIHFPAELKSRSMQIRLLDISGRVIEKKLVECCQGRESFKVHGIAKGVYLLTVESDNIVLRQKVVVQ